MKSLNTRIGKSNFPPKEIYDEALVRWMCNSPALRHIHEFVAREFIPLCAYAFYPPRNVEVFVQPVGDSIDWLRQ